jgi:hypothetical protein
MQTFIEYGQVIAHDPRIDEFFALPIANQPGL